ncbi:hypothetical protein ALP29_200386 [Pseudomonas syringae pv. avii]|uniref:Uncharacterized protein n=1 Tax=Pseudomonas syringae pv. avii TaxID=663959 RepID=A0A3M5U9A5_PSESX|nr:hypothetical protein ALP29_200386 [Pseudomonas syringae pv. avii]
MVTQADRRVFKCRRLDGHCGKHDGLNAGGSASFILFHQSIGIVESAVARLGSWIDGLIQKTPECLLGDFGIGLNQGVNASDVIDLGLLWNIHRQLLAKKW